MNGGGRKLVQGMRLDYHWSSLANDTVIGDDENFSAASDRLVSSEAGIFAESISFQFDSGISSTFSHRVRWTAELTALPVGVDVKTMVVPKVRPPEIFDDGVRKARSRETGAEVWSRS